MSSSRHETPPFGVGTGGSNGPAPLRAEAASTTSTQAAAPPGNTYASPPIIVAEHLTKRIGDKTLVENLTFDVQKGEIFGFIGPSGSGKTSTIRLLTGTYTPTEGRVRVMGYAPDHSSRPIQERLGYMPQLFVLYPNLTVEENLNFVAGIYGIGLMRRRSRIEKLLKFVELWDARDRLASQVSGGMQRRIELAASLLPDPPLLFVDEPTAGIDPVLRSKFWDEFRRLKSEGRTIFATTQYVSESEYCDRIGVIRHGNLIAVDTPVGLRRTAFGGDIVDIQAPGLTPGAVQALTSPDFVRRVEPVSKSEVRVHVEDAGSSIPVLLDIMQAQNCEVNKIEEYRPSFDEVFVQLMRRDALARGEDEFQDAST